jgi:hypothetical protein
MIADPGPAGDCTSAFTPPLVDDLDGDGTPSCSAECETDVDDIAAACGVVLPLPSCDPAHAIEALPDADCSAGDVMPGNGSCELAAGTYGAIRVRNGARITFAAGTTVACSVKAGKATRLTSAGTARVVVPGSGSVKVNNTSDAGSTCGALTFVTERGPIVLGRNGDFAIDACALRGKLKLGHANNLHGHFLGADVVMDFNNDGRCCTPAPPPTTTSTTVAGSPTTSTTSAGASTTSTTSSDGSSTTTTAPGATTTSTPASTTTSTTTPSGSGFTRTVGFYKTHPSITRDILAAHGPLTVCGQVVVDVDVDHAHSALEIMCVTPQGDVRLQLARQLMAAALSRAAGGAAVDLGPCDAVCTNAAATDAELASCVDAIDGYNQSGDAVTAPWGAPGAADPRPCDLAALTPCTVVAPGDCAAP